jgi:hypothetical protein
MEFPILTPENYVLFAMKHYDHPTCSGVEEFLQDLIRPKYIKRLFKRYVTKGVLRERLLINHIIIFYNMFGTEAGTRLLFFLIPPEYFPVLKTFLIALRRLDDTTTIDGINISDIPLDMHVADVLRQTLKGDD